jgi:hypothetical protein
MIAVCNTEIKFTDGTKHSRFQQIKVTEKDVSYFNVNYEFYDVKPHQSNRYYLYVNSETSASSGLKGFIAKDNHYIGDGLMTTTEFAFAMEFDNFNEASDYNANVCDCICIVFERKDLSLIVTPTMKNVMRELYEALNNAQDDDYPEIIDSVLFNYDLSHEEQHFIIQNYLEME